MIIEYIFPRRGEEADINISEDKTTGIIKITVEPYFYRPDGTPAVAYVRVVPEGKKAATHTEIQMVGGRTGQLRHRTRRNRVSPACDSKGKEPANE